MLEALTKRRDVLHQELNNAKQSMDLLGEQHERAKVQFHVVNGHFNECCYQLNEAQKASAVSPIPAAPIPQPEPVKELDNGEANYEEAQ